MSVDPWSVPRQRVEAIGRALAAARRYANHSMHDAAEACGIRRDEWCRLEHGRMMPTGLMALRLSEYVLQHHQSVETTPFRTPSPEQPQGPSQARTSDPDTSHPD